ncbi:hypothetical protein CFIMG_007719RA00001 [Ceratocystis fimbriata CBS 114723]|uniref:Uncharacterized protein n=1 Tax=Ceratocystis fimbriata CBS 114723 TaxID=1035309 RepID=A0A2C5WV61_9PEZI|nr:hypothetical protein CFIMG_007719RA00001 [Ceratocystis fimbriata CBS 114723]
MDFEIDSFYYGGSPQQKSTPQRLAPPPLLSHDESVFSTAETYDPEGDYLQGLLFISASESESLDSTTVRFIPLVVVIIG